MKKRISPGYYFLALILSISGYYPFANKHSYLLTSTYQTRPTFPLTYSEERLNAYERAGKTKEPLQIKRTLRDEVKSIFDSQVGVKEQTGKNDGEEVEKYLQYVGFSKGYPWCAAFVCWVYNEARISNPKSAWSPSMFPSKKIIYQRNDKKRNGTPQRADTFGIWFNNLKRVAHVGFVDNWQQGSYFISVEGNTNNTHSREGDGVYKKRRLKSQVYQVSDFISAQE